MIVFYSAFKCLVKYMYMYRYFPILVWMYQYTVCEWYVHVHVYLYNLPLSTDYPGLVTPPGTPSKRNPSLPVPTDNQLSYPIRRYISETLICHVLGQPSYSLSCLLVCAISQYIDTTSTIVFDVPMTIEDICKKVTELFITKKKVLEIGERVDKLLVYKIG